MKSMAILTDCERIERLAELETKMEILIAANPQLEQFRRKKIYFVLSTSYENRDQASQARQFLRALQAEHFELLKDTLIATTSDKLDFNRYICEISQKSRPDPVFMAEAELLNSYAVEMFDGAYRGWHVAIPDRPSFKLTPSGIRPS